MSSVSLTALRPDLVSLNDHSQSTYGKSIVDAFKNLISAQDVTTTLGWGALLRGELEDIYRECNQVGWDGYDAEPLSLSAYKAAKRFIDSLCYVIARPPEAIPQPNGYVSFDWSYCSKLLSIAVEPGQIIFVFVNGSEKIYGEIPFYYEVPEKILSMLESEF